MAVFWDGRTDRWTDGRRVGEPSGPSTLVRVTEVEKHRDAQAMETIERAISRAFEGTHLV